MLGGPSRLSVLLVETEEGVIKDVSFGLGLINQPLEVAPSVLDAKKSIVRRKPALVIARNALGGEPKAAERLARELSEHGEYEDLTVVGLYDHVKELPAEDEKPSRTYEAISLPLEFPLFSRKIEEYLARSKVNAARVQVQRDSVRDQLSMARALQERVLQLVERELAAKSGASVPELVLEATRIVCGELTRGDAKRDGEAR
jgi:hypothetical protein